MNVMYMAVGSRKETREGYEGGGKLWGLWNMIN